MPPRKPKQIPRTPKRTSKVSLANKIKSVIKNVAEKKEVDLNYTDSNLDTTGDMWHLTTVAQGDTNNTREGNKIQILSYSMKYAIALNATATDAVIRMILFTDLRQVGSTSPSITDVLQSSGPSELMNTTNKGRFKVHRDRYFSITATKSLLVGKMYVNFNMMDVRYNNTTGSSIEKNGLYLMVLSNEATYPPILQVRSRLRYVDI